RSSVKRSRRERRPCFGELVQIDGSHHPWFEDRADRCVLMVMIDDATGWTWAQFFEQETTVAAMTVVGQWARTHGLARELYPDQDSIYRVNTKEAREQYDRTGKRPPTQFGRAMAELGVRVTCAHSPQAKGRVERMNRTLQDRLVKALRVAKIRDIEAANAYLREVFLPELNGRFAIEPASEIDAHLAVGEAELVAALCIKEQRTASRDQCVSYEGRVLQLSPARAMGSLADKRLTIEHSLEGIVRVLWHGKAVEHKVVTRHPGPTTPKLTLRARVARHQPMWKPPAHHPWKRQRVGG
ncbi:MAG: ISNCY family transposase, partial [Actinobacteria bacterium]|nr:ISNCY family transposase [Actinomycetota bacterium]